MNGCEEIPAQRQHRESNMTTSFIFPDTSKLVLTAGGALYGDVDDWMSLMASDMGVQPGTVSDWANARRTPSHANIEHLELLVRSRAERASQVAVALARALPRMLCPVPGCGARLSVLHAPGERIIQCSSAHFFREKDGPPFGPFVEKEFRRVAENETLAPRATLWLAKISERDFPEFERRVKGLRGPYAAYLEHLERRAVQWQSKPGSEVIPVSVTVADLDRYCVTRGGSCTARELTGLAKLKLDGRL
jgi:hypothetical protein